jgi:glycerol-3-phosphate acyltransferase PlsY
MLAVLMMAVSSLVFKLTIIKDISWVTISLLFFLAVIVIVRHRENIKRILEGTESSFVKINKK